MNSLKRKDDSDNDIIYLESKPPTKKVQLPTENTIKAFKEAQRVAEKRKNELNKDVLDFLPNIPHNMSHLTILKRLFRVLIRFSIIQYKLLHFRTNLLL